MITEPSALFLCVTDCSLKSKSDSVEKQMGSS